MQLYLHIILGLLVKVSSLLPVCIITSPSPKHPSTEQVWDVIRSIERNVCPDVSIHVVCDGVRTRAETKDLRGDHDFAMSKKGVVTLNAKAMYDHYKSTLSQELESQKERTYMTQLNAHAGFALAVKFGVEQSADRGEEFCLVCQHDRTFVSPVALQSLLTRLRSDASLAHVNAVHFPTESSLKLLRDWKWHKAEPRPLASDDVTLLPLPFFYDSNFLVRVSSFVQTIYRPFRSLPPPILTHLGASNVSKFVLRKGDFIEDRLGQAVRSSLKRFVAEGETELVESLVRWMGTYSLASPHALVKHSSARKYPRP